MSYASCGPLLYAEAFIRKKRKKKPGPISTTVNTVYTVTCVKMNHTDKLQCAILLCLSHHNTSSKHP